MKNRIIELRKQASKAKRNFVNKSIDSSCFRLIQNEGNTFVYYYNRPVAIFPTEDLFARNVAIINIYLNQKVTQETLSKVFDLSRIRIRQLVRLYRDKGLSGLSGPDPTRFSNEGVIHSDSTTLYKETLEEIARENNLVIQANSASNQENNFKKKAS